jgi:hypothetical protein
MIVAKFAVGTEDVFIETEETPVRVVGADGGPTGEAPALKPTGLADGVTGAYQKAKSAIKEIAKDFSANLLDAMVKGQKLELEFGMSLSASGSIWVISGKSECTLKVRISWEAK